LYIDGENKDHEIASKNTVSMKEANQDVAFDFRLAFFVLFTAILSRKAPYANALSI